MAAPGGHEVMHVIVGIAMMAVGDSWSLDPCMGRSLRNGDNRCSGDPSDSGRRDQRRRGDF